MQERGSALPLESGPVVWRELTEHTLGLPPYAAGLTEPTPYIRLVVVSIHDWVDVSLGRQQHTTDSTDLDFEVLTCLHSYRERSYVNAFVTQAYEQKCTQIRPDPVAYEHIKYPLEDTSRDAIRDDVNLIYSHDPTSTVIVS